MSRRPFGVPPSAAALLERCTFPPPGTEVTCAVSGGADSLALLALAASGGCDVTAVHVDHGLRLGSASEADVVRDAAEAVGARFRSEQVEVLPGPNLEARARAARYAVLPADVLTGHTADDQAETILLNLLRGSGRPGLSGMRPEGHPLLGLRRTETQDLCRELGWRPVEDPSNLDPAHRRNRVRRELVPLLCDIAQRDVVPVLVRQAELIGDESDLLAQLAGAIDATDAAALTTAPVPLARLAVREWIRAETDDPHPPDAAAVERVLAVARGEAVATEVAGSRVARTAGRLRIEPAAGH